MGETVRLKTDDGHTLSAWRARPEGAPRGGVVVLQEIFGINDHVRDMTERLAAEGYAALAPALFDRLEPGVEMGYEEADFARGRELRARLGWDAPVKDTGAAMRELADAGEVGVVGFCWGGSLAWLAATRLSPACAVCYYGAQIVDFKDEKPNAPVLMHFGDMDHLAPPDHAAAVRAAQPGVVLHTYPAGHGFACDFRADFEPESAALAWQRTLDFLARHIGG